MPRKAPNLLGIHLRDGTWIRDDRAIELIDKELLHRAQLESLRKQLYHKIIADPQPANKRT